MAILAKFPEHAGAGRVGGGAAAFTAAIVDERLTRCERADAT